jgi:hypothetical protein
MGKLARWGVLFTAFLLISVSENLWADSYFGIEVGGGPYLLEPEGGTGSVTNILGIYGTGSRSSAFEMEAGLVFFKTRSDWDELSMWGLTVGANLAFRFGWSKYSDWHLIFLNGFNLKMAFGGGVNFTFVTGNIGFFYDEFTVSEMLFIPYAQVKIDLFVFGGISFQMGYRIDIYETQKYNLYFDGRRHGNATVLDTLYFGTSILFDW